MCTAHTKLQVNCTNKFDFSKKTLRISNFCCIFAPNFDAKEVNMTALQLNATIYRNLGIIAEDESKLRKVAKYISRMAKQMTEDPTCMTKEEFFSRIDEADKGPKYRMLPNESMDEMLTRLGYV